MTTAWAIAWIVLGALWFCALLGLAVVFIWGIMAMENPVYRCPKCTDGFFIGHSGLVLYPIKESVLSVEKGLNGCQGNGVASLVFTG